MPKLSHAGNHANQSDLILSNIAVKQVQGLYCLNDLHKASGGNSKHTPSRFLRNKDTQELIQAIDDRNQTPKTVSQNPNLGSEVKSTAYMVINGGNMQGVYACRELVYAYASWIDKRFYLLVLEVFNEVINQSMSYREKISRLSAEIDIVTKCLSASASYLSTNGKVRKPLLVKELNTLLDEQQLTLDLGV